MRLNFTDMSKVVSVFFSAELSNECSTGYTFGLTSLTGKLLLSKTLKTNDKLRIFGVFQTNSSVHTKSYEYIISENGKGILQPENKISAGETTCANRHQSEPQDDKGDIVFEEYFDDRTRWENYVFIGRSGKQEDHAIFVKNTTALKNGNMLITAHLTQFVFILNLTDCTHEKGLCFQKYRPPQMPPPIHSGAVFTKQLFEHGHFEVRAKFPKGDFLRPCSYIKTYLKKYSLVVLLYFYLSIDIMLQQAEKKFGADFAKQIHIAYANGNEQLMDRTHNEMGGSTVAGSVVISPSWKGDFIEHKRFKRHKENKHYGDEFHNYTMIWKPDSITYKVDGEFFGAIKDKKVLDELQNQKVYYNCICCLNIQYNYSFF